MKLAIGISDWLYCGIFVGGAINRMLYNIDPLLSQRFHQPDLCRFAGFLGFYAPSDFLDNRRKALGSIQWKRAHWFRLFR